MTHSEMTHLLPSPPGIPYSACPGEMALTELSEALARYATPAGRRTLRRTELYHCRRCGYTIHLEVDIRNVRRITNAYPAPSLPSLRVV